MLITGATGFLGSHLVDASEAGRWELLAESSGSLDIRRRDAVIDHIRTWRPNVVVHLAYRRGDRQIIVDGTRNVAEGAAAAGARLIHMSTDVVFAGRAQPYKEHDLPDANIDYGRWKAEAEAAAYEVHPTALAVRTSLLYGTERRAVCQTDVADALEGRSRTQFFTDEYRCPAHAADVAAALVALSDMPDITGVLHVAGPQAVSRAQLAQAFAVWMGRDPTAVPTASLAETGADRPGTVALDTSAATALGLGCRSLDEALR